MGSRVWLLCVGLKKELEIFFQGLLTISRLKAQELLIVHYENDDNVKNFFDW